MNFRICSRYLAVSLLLTVYLEECDGSRIGGEHLGGSMAAVAQGRDSTAQLEGERHWMSHIVGCSGQLAWAQVENGLMIRVDGQDVYC